MWEPRAGPLRFTYSGGDSTTSIGEYIEAARNGILRGVECSECGHSQVTTAETCAKCGSANLAKTDFSNEGTVVTYTILDVPSELFIDDAPYAFVVVQLEDGPRCTGWMPYVKRPGDIAIGDKVRFVKTYKPGMVFEKVS
ncbi:MAG: Zn-ribbon domain-containing OB-fold protein [Thermoplasmata archaeon]